MRNATQKELDLNRIYVASPCPASWESMHGDDRARACEQCGLNVYNISGLTKSEAVDLIQNRQGRICVRLRRRADGSVITQDCPKGLRATRIRVAKFAGSVLATILGLFSINFAQRVKIGGDSRGIRSETYFEIARVEGNVKDANGVPIPDATVTITTSSGKKLVGKTNRSGRFQVSSFALQSGKNLMRITAEGFSPFVDNFTIRRREMIDYPVILDAGHLVGVVVVRDEPMIDLRKSSISTTIYFGDN